MSNHFEDTKTDKAVFVMCILVIILAFVYAWFNPNTEIIPVAKASLIQNETSQVWSDHSYRAEMIRQLKEQNRQLRRIADAIERYERYHR